MNLKYFWQHIPNVSFRHEDFHTQRQNMFLGAFLNTTLIILAIVTILNLLEFFFKPGPNTGLFLVQDFATGAIILGLLYLKRRGYVQIAAYGFILFCMLIIPFVSPPEWQPFSILFFIIPVQASSFIIRPSASLVAVLFPIPTYLLFQTNLPESEMSTIFSFLAVLGMCATAAWFVANRLEKALKQSRQSELQYMELLEKNPFCIYMTSGGQAGRWLYVSPRIYDLLGMTPEAWLAGDALWRQMIHPLDQPAVFAEIKRCQETNTPFQAEYRMLNSTGQTVWINDNAVKVSSADQPDLVQGVLLDITGRKRAEQVQAAIYHISQAAFAANDLDELYLKIHGVLAELMHAENFFIALYDRETGMLNFPYFVDQYDPPPEPSLARHGLTEYVLRTGQAVFANAQDCIRLVALGEISDVGTPSVDWLGVPLIINNRSIGVMAVQSYSESIRFSLAELDILKFVSTQVAMTIERKRNDAALREINQLTSEVISSVNTGIIVANHQGQFLIWNRYMEQITGIPKEQVIGQPTQQVIQYTDANLLNGIIVQSLAGEINLIPDIEYAIPHTHRSGWLSGYCGPHRDSQGEIIGVIIVLNEITARKQAEEALRTALREKEVMMREIHHRVKNNLQVMSSLISLQADSIPNEMVRGHFREIQARVRSMALVHEELYQSQDFSRVNLAEYFEKLTAGLMSSFAINPYVEVKVDVAAIFLSVDVAIPCGLIINELVTNAFKYAFPADRPGEINITVQQKADGLVVMQVRDNGVGIPAEVDIYNTETLGMQLITILTRQLRGNLQVERVGGTCFQIEFRESRTLPS